MMKVRKFIWIWAAAACVLCGCQREPLSGEPTGTLCVRLRLPESLTSKADSWEGLSPTDAETVMKDLRIWVYLSEDFDATRKAGYRLGYINPNQGTYRQTGFEDRYFLIVPAEIAQAQPDVDVYVLANTASLNLKSYQKEGVSCSSLDALTFTGSYFGIKADGTPEYTALTSNGLPYSAVGKQLKMDGAYPSLNVETVTLERLVSKLRIVTSRLSDAVGPVVEATIDAVEIDGGQIPVQEYVFNDSGQPYKIGTDYVSQALSFPVPDSIASNENPVEYAWNASYTPEAYEAKVLSGIAAGDLTEIGMCYLRESDKPLSGTIRYTMGGVQYTRSFQAPAGGFARNHSWTVYFYFLRDQMQFTVSYTPWEHGADFTVTQ